MHWSVEKSVGNVHVKKKNNKKKIKNQNFTDIKKLLAYFLEGMMTNK